MRALHPHRARGELMRDYERFIAPGLGIVIILATFILGAPLVYRVLLGILGLAAAGTYFAPHRVQVETRLAIAALGLIILLIVSSTAFWLALLSFAVIGALQLPNRHLLKRNPATIAWLRTALRGVKARRFGRADLSDDAEGEAAEVAAEAANGEGKAPSTLAGIGEALPGFVRLNAAGVGGLIAGVIVLGSVFMPWYGFLVSGYGELEDVGNLTLRAGAQEFGLPALTAFFWVVLLLGVLSIISIGLPRLVAGIIAAAGFAVTLASYFYLFAEVEREAAELRSVGLGVTTIPAAGCLIAGLVFLVMLALQLIPRANRSRSQA